ncbi:MAG TPA: MFS transporter [Thermoplasmata archaeon]|nr:MFS transporter [Thermoplasmata archaeon]
MSAAPPEPAATSVVAPAPEPEVSRRFEILVVLGIMLALLMGALDQFVVLTVLTAQRGILAEFGQPNSGSLVITAYLIPSTIAIPVFGKLSDLWSRRNVFIGGLVIFMAGSMLAGLSQSLNELIAFRALQGFGSGGFFPVGISIVAVSFPPATRARVTGLLSGVFGIATVAGPLIGSAIVDATTWRWVFYVNLPVGAAGLAAIAYALGPLRPTLRRHFDVPGAALLVGWVGALEYALVQVAYAGWAWGDPRVLGLLLGSAVGVVAFVYWELRVAEEPLVPLRLATHRIVSVGGTTTFLVGAVFFPLTTFVSLVVGEALTPAGANSANVVRDVLYALVLPVVVGAALGGQLLTRLTYRVQVVAGLALSIVGMVLLRGISPATPPWKLAFGFLPVGGIVLPLIPIGLGIGITFPVFFLAVQNEVPPDDVGEASGLIQFLQSLGGSIGLSLLASYAVSRVNGLDPSPSAVCLGPGGALQSVCASYFRLLPAAEVTAYDAAFTLMLGALVVALGTALFLRGKFLKGPETTGRSAADALPSRDGGGAPP